VVSWSQGEHPGELPRPSSGDEVKALVNSRQPRRTPCRCRQPGGLLPPTGSGYPACPDWPPPLLSSYQQYSVLMLDKSLGTLEGSGAGGLHGRVTRAGLALGQRLSLFPSLLGFSPHPLPFESQPGWMPPSHTAAHSHSHQLHSLQELLLWGSARDGGWTRTWSLHRCGHRFLGLPKAK
jgi:hypothetical protein